MDRRGAAARLGVPRPRGKWARRGRAGRPALRRGSARGRTLISTVTSYTLALRLDGVDPALAREAFAASGARQRRAGEWANFDLGREWSVPSDSRLAPLGSLAARPAVGSEAVLLARSALAREAMERRDPPAMESEEVAAAAGCLGDVLAARLVLLCAVGDPGRVDAAADALEGAFAPAARDGVSGEQMDELVVAAELETYEEDGHGVARVALTRAEGTDRGFLFGAFDRGSALTYMGLQPPPSPGG